MFIFIAIAMLAVYGLLVYYVGRSVWKWVNPRPSLVLKIIYAVVLTVVATSFITGRFIGSVPLLSMIGSYWMAVFYLLIILIPVMHIVLLLLKLTTLPRHTVQKAAGYAVLVLLIGLISYGSYNAYSPVVRTYEVKIEKNAGGLDNLNVVLASDMHFGLLSGKSHAERMVKEINALQPDLILFPGDIIDDDLDAYLRQGIDEVLTGLEARYGVYASLGNHDRDPIGMQALIDTLERSGMTVLYDESLVVEDQLTLVGRKDYSDRNRSNMATLMQDVDLSKPVIVLDHQPNALQEAREQGADLIVSGHTHRGQVFPAHLITRALFENDYGYMQQGSFHSIVTSGYGFWGPPIRLGSQSEIVMIQVAFEG
ncbi:metallophosphoesterase [Paenibacillus sp. FSL M8-0334]|nr:metallophosphoesterase [Paenibacillus campinasensis]